jgi:hypothetical protein
LNLGNIDGVVAVFVAVSDGDTFETGLSVVEHVSVNSFSAASVVGAVLPSTPPPSGTITFDVAGFPTPTVSIIAYGFN